jgi:hypothetical protein
MKRILCIICTGPASHVCPNGNVLCAGCLATIRNRKTSVPPASSLYGESAPAAAFAPESLAAGASQFHSGESA